MCEWTMEYQYKNINGSMQHCRMDRGGCYKCGGWLAGRNCAYQAEKSDICQGFRPTMYIAQ